MALPNALIVGTGEYVSGVVNLEQSTSDKVENLYMEVILIF
jgi:hypothetical protein